MYLFCTLIKEGQCSVLCVGKASLFNECHEDLSVKEVSEECRVSRRVVFEEQPLVDDRSEGADKRGTDTSWEIIYHVYAIKCMI